MRRRKPPLLLAYAIFRANGERCFYCGSPILSHLDLEIDHLIPLSTRQDRLQIIARDLELGDDFDVDSPLNLVPTHRSCNRRKANLELTIQDLRFYFALWGNRQSKVEVEFNTLKRRKRIERLLADLATAVEVGELNADKVLVYLREIDVIEPWVAAFSVYLPDLEESELWSISLPKDQVEFYDSMEDELRLRLCRLVTPDTVQIESERNGETISVRFIFWPYDLAALKRADLAPWDLLELAPFEEIYGLGSYFRFGKGYQRSTPETGRDTEPVNR